MCTTSPPRLPTAAHCTSPAGWSGATASTPRSCFFRQDGGAWAADATVPRLTLQDPFVCRIGGELVVGGVEVFDDTERPGQLNYRTVFLRGASLHSLQRFACGRTA